MEPYRTAVDPLQRQAHMPPTDAPGPTHTLVPLTTLYYTILHYYTYTEKRCIACPFKYVRISTEMNIRTVCIYECMYVRIINEFNRDLGETTGDCLHGTYFSTFHSVQCSPDQLAR